MEITLSSFAWIGVVLLNAFVHYSLKYRKKRADDDVPALDASPLVLERNLKSANVSIVSDGAVTAETVGQSFDEEDDSLDGDEPEIFFELLAQTGSEMMSVSCTFGHCHTCLF